MPRDLGTLVAAVLITGLMASSPASAENETGRLLVVRNCGRCHAVGLDDRSPLPLAPPFREVVKRYPPDNLAEALAEGIVTGHDGMPEFVFEPVQIVAIVDYLQSLKRP